MDNEMIERCAKALFDLDQDKAYTQHVINPIMYGVKGKIEWNFITDEQKVIAYVNQVKALLLALREPTENMKSAGSMNLPDYDPSDDDAKLCWYNMINAIIGDE